MKRRKTIKWKTGCKKVLATMVAVSMFLTSSVGFAPEAVSAAVKTEATSAEEDANTTLEVTSELSTEDSTSDTTEASEATTAEQVTEETDGNGTYTVTLEDLNHGSILFYDKATKQTEKETSKSFDEGDSVLVQFKPDVGYTVKSFYISDTNGEKLYEKETSDDQFTFTMPAMDLMIGGTVQEEDVSIDTEASEGLQVYGNPYAEDPWYLESMKEYLASKGMSKNDDAKIDYGAGTACATLVSQAFNYAYKQEYGKDFGFHNINSSTNLFKDLMASDLGFESIYNGEVYNSAKKLVLQPGDILLFNMHYTAFNSSGNITNNEDFDHACFVYDVDEDANKIWIANHRGESSHEAYIKNFNRVVYCLTNQSNPAVYKRMLTKTEAENYEKTGKLEEDSDEISLEEISLDDFNIELEAEQYYDFMTVLRLKKDEDKPGSFKIVKNGNKTSVTRYHYSNGVKDEDNTISLKTLQSKYCSKYGLLSSARFTAYSDSSAKNKAEIYTDAACTKKADASKLIANKTYYVKSVPEAGIKLYVKETKTPKGWSTDTATKTITVKTTGTAKATFTDQFTGDPLNLTLYKEGAIGNKLAGAKFKLTRKASGDEDKDQSWTFVTDSDGKIMFDNIAYLYQGAVYLSGNKIRFYAGNYTLEEVTPPSGYKAKGSYTLVDANNTVLQTATAFDGEVFSFKIDSVNGVAQTKIDTVYISNQMKLTASDTPKMIGFKVQKRNLDTGDTTLEGSMTDYTTTFRLIYTGRAGDTDDTYTWYDKNLNGTVDSGEKIHKKDATHSGVVGTFTTNSSGYFELSGKSLQAGTYQIQETNAPSGMLKSTAAQLAGQSILGNSVINFPADWTASTDGHVYDLTGQAKALKNPAARGGVAAYKYDADTLYPAPQSGSSFNGISFYVRNDNANPVYLDTDGDGIGNTKLDAGSSVKIGDITDAMPYAWTNATFLPVGNYTLYETLGNNTSYTASVYAQSFTIDTDGKYILMAKEEHKEALIQFLNQQLAVQIQYLGILGRSVTYQTLGPTKIISNRASRHGLAITKYDADDRTRNPQGNATLIGATYEIYNKNSGAIMVDTNGDGTGDTSVAQNGLCATITTMIDPATGFEYASTNPTLLPNGTYLIKEKTAPTGYEKTASRASGNNGSVEITYRATGDNQYHLFTTTEAEANTLKNVITALYPGHTFDWQVHAGTYMSNPVKRGKLSLKKNDADKKSHKMTGTIASASSDYGTVSNDNESKYAQGDASFEKAVYEIYNISTHYVYTAGSNAGATYKRYETGKDTFKAITGIDPAGLTFKDGVHDTFLSTSITEEMMDQIRTQMTANVCYTLVTDKKGEAETKADSLPVGTYLVLEKTPSAGYLNSTIRGGETAKIIKISEDGEVVSLNYDATDLEKSLYEPVIRGGFEVYKYDEETKMNVPLGSADLSASFEVINRSKDYVWVDTNENGTFEDDECYAPGAVVFTFTTDKKTGRYTSKADLLPYGTYEIHETYPPYGYLHLSNINPNLSVFFEIREEGKIVDEGWYYDKDGKKVTSHTHYAPILDAYDEDGVKIPNEEIVGERKEVTDARLIIYNFVVRGDLYFEKKSAVDMKKMAYIPFLMTSYDENGNAIESHIIFTDQNGNYNSSTLYVDHTYETNAGDEMYDWLTAYNEAYDNEDTETLKKLDEEYKTLVTKYKKGVGTWFGLNTKVSDDLGRHGTLDQSLNATGALPFGTYTIEELRCPNNKDYELVSDTIILDTDAAETDAATDPEGYKSHSMHGTINFGTIYNRKDKLGISTVALTQDEESHYSHAYSDLVIVDSVTYNNVIPGNSYKMVAELHDVATGDILYDDWGEEIRVTKEFTPKLATDILKMNLTFDAYDYKDGGSVVVYEYLYEIVDGKENLVAKEANASTKDQQIHFPSLASELTDEKTGEHMIGVEDDTEYTLVDLITFKNLEIGETYVVDGYLIDKNETDYLKADGSYIKADVYDKDDTRFAHNKEGNIIFKPDTNDGTFKLVYKVKGKDVKGKTAVSFVNVEKNRNSIAKHMEITDEKQTMYFPDVHTTVYDKETGIPMSFADDKITVVDTVAYESLLPKQTYELLGTLVNKETGKTVTDKSGKEVTAKATFVPETSSGTTDVVFEFDGTGLDGTTLVAFEALYLGSTKLVDHNDINDSDETFYIGKIKTKARNAENGTQLANPDGSITITDTVIYENLIPERYYKLVGKILDESTGKVLLDKNGKEITASATFKPEKANGETDVTFAFTGYEELKGKKAVCVETLYVDVIKDAKTEKATTTDADGTDEVSDKDSDFRIVAKEDTMPNEDQTIYFPDLHTTAYDATVGINMTKADKAKVIDRVEYENLIPGLTYEVKGTIIDKATEKTVEVNGKDVTASATFTPDKASGSVDVVFEFDATDLAGKTLVAYEDLYIESSLIKQHRYIDDEAETFYIPKIGTEAKDAENSTHVGEAKENASIIDTISYENLIAGREYLVVGQLINKSNETAVLLKDGVEFNSETGECVSGPGHYQIMSFTPEKKNGTVDMTFNFDATGLAGSSVVVYEEIYVKIDNKLYPVADHKDLSNTSQTIDYPGVTTTAKNKADDTHYAKPEKITIVDAVNYTNLEVGKTYTVTGTLMSRKTGKAITKKDKSGKSVPITSTVTFEAEKKNGTIDLEFTVDATDLAGDTVVCFERVYWNKIQVASHTDINDESQSVHIVSIGTTALDSSTKEHITKNGKTVIVDTVKYEGLIPNTEYVISGKLMDKATGKSLKKGTKASKIKTLVNKVSGKSNEYISEIKFTPTTADGSVDIKFEVDTSDLSGKTLVCYEAVYENNKKIASHEDINSEEQAVYVPHISTKLVDKLTKTKNTVYSNKTVLVDTISYENLIPNITYTISGKLIDKETGKEIAIANSTNKDKKNMVTITFTPKKSNGTVDAEFVIDTTNLSGKTLVCYEYLYVNNVEIAKHEDKNSEDQSAYTIEIGTKATVDGKKTAKKSEKTVVVDTISCKNLIVGQEYIMKGELIDKATKKSTGITSTVTFKANKANATVKMEFTVDTTKYDSLVAYEELYIKDKLVAQHKDINSKDQTVTFTKDTPPDKVKTGGGILLFLLIVMTLGSGVYGIYNIRRKRRYLK